MRLFLTVGKNPLPVLAAAYRLGRVYGTPDESAAITLIHSGESELEAKAIEDVLGKKFQVENIRISGIKRLRIEGKCPGAIGSAIAGSLNGGTHLHYTGGTKAMGIEAFRALSNGKGTISTSYLDIDSHQVLDENGALLDRSAIDERRYWNLGIEQFAELHGLTLRFEATHPAVYQVAPGLARTDKTISSPEPGPSAALIGIANGMLSTLARPGAAAEFGRAVGGRFRIKNFPKLPTVQGDEENWPWPEHIGPGRTTGWCDIPDAFNSSFGLCWRPDGDRWFFNPESLPPETREMAYNFLAGGWLEAAVYSNLPAGRTFTGIRLMRKNAAVKSPFELDVVTILGYQPVAFSVTASGDNKRVLNKAFEAWHRVRQIGGDGARAVIVTMLEKKNALDLEENLFVDFGAEQRTLTIWSREECVNLAENIRKYLRGLKWSDA
jgi:hypothetical protein